MQDRFQQKFNQKYHYTQKKPHEEGKVTIEKIKDSEKEKPNNVGEYVDFEEVEE